MSEAGHYRLDDLRRFAGALGSAAGLSPNQASRLVAYLLWFDAIGATSFGIQTFPRWLERLTGNEFERGTSGVVTLETLGTVILDGRQGVPPLILSRAGELATEKARDAGIGVVRVDNLASLGPVAPIVAGMASGPCAALIFGPNGQHALALPTDNGPPTVYDTALNQGVDGSTGKSHELPSQLALEPALKPWLSALVPEGDWLIVSLRIDAIESLSTFLERGEAAMKFDPKFFSQVLPSVSEEKRRAARELGIPLTPPVRDSLFDWAVRLGVEPTI